MTIEMNRTAALGADCRTGAAGQQPLKRLVGRLSTCLAIIALLPCSLRAADKPAQPLPPLQPRIVGDWWPIAGEPNLGELTATNQQPVDFAIWQAADGSWQLWSCIRATREAGHTRLFYRWESPDLTNPDWKPMGIAMRADSRFGEARGGLQAPFVFRNGERFIMAYGSWDHICSAASADGKQFDRLLNAASQATLFGEPSGNTRDPMVIRIGDLWHCYYTAHPQNHGADYCRTSRNLQEWSPPRIVARGGRAGDGPWSAECPFVVQLQPGQFYLFRTQHYGQNAQTSVYYSRDPFDFGVDNDSGHFVCTLRVAAAELIRHNGQWFIAALQPNLKGIRLCRLTWDNGTPATRSDTRL